MTLSTDTKITSSHSTMQPQGEQVEAISAMLDFCTKPFDPSSPFFLLQGPAGTGKTFCIQELLRKVQGRVILTAPTNKAVRVLKKAATSEDYKPVAKTIHSLLGLKMEANGELKELTAPEDPIDLSNYLAIIVDEASMVNKELMGYINKASEKSRVRFIFLGDGYQLPPVKEISSPALQIENGKKLLKIRRHDNQILNLVTYIREKVLHPAPNLKFSSDNDGQEGVWKLSSETAFVSALQRSAKAGAFSEGEAKAIAWRNVRVDEMNQTIRQAIFGNESQTQWLPTDRFSVLSPAKDLEGKIIATTDEEGRVEAVSVTDHPEYPHYKVFNLTVVLDSDNSMHTLRVLHPSSAADFKRELEYLAAAARSDKRQWKYYWELFEAFHQVRHGYAQTAHRSQGSTYDSVFVDWRDILLNRNRREAMQCLYVACSRPRKILILS